MERPKWFRHIVGLPISQDFIGRVLEGKAGSPLLSPNLTLPSPSSPARRGFHVSSLAPNHIIIGLLGHASRSASVEQPRTLPEVGLFHFPARIGVILDLLGHGQSLSVGYSPILLSGRMGLFSFVLTRKLLIMRVFLGNLKLPRENPRLTVDLVAEVGACNSSDLKVAKLYSSAPVNGIGPILLCLRNGAVSFRVTVRASLASSPFLDSVPHRLPDVACNP